ncbi:P-loop containing nucleoside triphosphate hydrolase [Lasallia pustulata]|uniref:p-loop containing nucleoside triphosphate hydrolase n=1 Tax=Lasallia pustulata TaxID=136370 RepID=A0A1W5D090_9LECA|nr:P-loop containing nucleoside triphosphate hydrolase [Lasallia pustulata]
MGPSDEQNVHPFFRGRKKIPAAPASVPVLSAGDHATTIPTDGDLSGQWTVQNAVSTGGVETVVDSGMAVTEGRQSATETGVSLITWHDDSNLDTDPNYGRSKRRRTASPGTQSLLDTSPSKRTWQKQLEAAAYISPQQEKKEPSPTVMQREGGRITAVIKGHGDTILETTSYSIGSVDNQYSAPPVENGTVSMDPNETELTAGKLEEQSEMNDLPEPKTPRKKRTPTKGASKKATPTKESPKRKILKLSSDGKLGSPQSRAAAVIRTRTRGRGKSTSTKGMAGTKIVAIKYGSTQESKASVAQRIQNILVSTTVNQYADTTHQTKSSKPPLLMKSTHPFFLGKTGRKSGSEQNSTETVGPIASAGQQPALAEKSSPKKAKHANGAKARREAWSALSGFDSRSMGQHDLKAIKIPGAEPPPWPPKDMVHIRDLPSISFGMGTVLPKHDTTPTDRKMKGATVQIPEEEDVLLSITRKLHVFENGTDNIPHPGYQIPDSLRLPVRRVMTGSELQQAIQPRLTCTFPVTGKTAARVTAKLDDPHVEQPPTHNAISQLYGRLTSSQSAFDKAECETQAWVQKFAPKCASDVLQQGREAILLRDWMKSLKVTSVDSGNKDPSSTRESSVASKRRNIKSKNKKRRRREELDGFVISSDEEAVQMDELTDPEAIPSLQGHHSPSKKTVIRTGDTSGILRSPRDTRITNAVVISGPHGCGKSATVYALAHELDFEVFEINAGSRRNGRDLLDRVGDMTRNHLVQRSSGTESEDTNEDLVHLAESMKQDLESGRQSNMNAFFKPKPVTGKRPKPKAIMKTNQPKVERPAKRQRNQKQSLILLEEVDVLFEEDKQFWVTTLSLILQSKRPIVMTCTDETLLPLGEMALYGIFRFVPAPEAMVTDYLLLMAANEGHILSPNATLALYRYKRRDLRASITELQFYCQMGIGDTKGGLEWMLIGMSANEALKRTQGVLRIVSEGSYLEGMGWLGRDNISLQTEPSASEEAELMLEAWNELGVRPEDCQTSETPEYMMLGSHRSDETSLEARLPPKSREHLKALEDLDEASEALSASDIFPALGFRCDNAAILDTTLPAMADKVRNDFIEGFPLLQADPVVDPTGLSTSIPVQLRLIPSPAQLPSGVNANTSTNLLHGQT